MEFVITGDVGGFESYHVGDEAMLQANLDGLRRLLPGVQFTVVSRDPEWTRACYGVNSILPLGFPYPAASGEHSYDSLLSESMDRIDREETEGDGTGGGVPRSDSLSEGVEGFRARRATFVDHLRRSDGLIISGGGNLCSTWPHHLYERVAQIFLADRLGKPIAVLGQTLGPSLTSRERELLTSALRMASIVAVREQPSYDLAVSMAIPAARLLKSLDDAFYLDGTPTSIPELRHQPFEISKPWIALTFSSFLDPKSQAEEVDALASQIDTVALETGAPLVFIPHAGSALGSPSDRAIGTNLAIRIRSPLRLLELHLASEVRWLTEKAAMVISNRYHPLVFGISSAVPCLGIYTDEYTQVKVQGVLRQAGLGEWAISAKNALNGELADRACELWQKRDDVRAYLLDKQPDWRRQFTFGWRVVLERLGVPLA